MKLYYAPGACSLADHIALIEAGLPFESEQVDLKAKTTVSGEDFSKVNPKGYVPALALDGGAVLTENIAILCFIADKAGRLMPPSGLPHWRVLETLAFISTELHKNFKPFFKPDSTDAEKAAARDMLNQRFGLVEGQLGDRDFVVGDEMSVADCYLYVMLRWATEKAGITLPARLAAHFDRINQRPAVKRALADEGLD